MSAFAQTNLQLANQLRAQGYSEEDEQFIAAAYQVAIRLFSNAFRPSGKPFLAHLVGTASILAWLRAPRNLVVTGVLHAAYSHGEFGAGWTGVVDTKREQMRQTVGSDVEALIAAYTKLSWNSRTIPVVRDGFDSLSDMDRAVLLVRLANELEDHLDCGVLYCTDAERRIRWIHTHRSIFADLAVSLGSTELAGALQRQFDAVLESSIPPPLQKHPNDSYRVVPLSRSDWRKTASAISWV